jgi:hypothetical protein
MGLWLVFVRVWGRVNVRVKNYLAVVLLALLDIFEHKARIGVNVRVMVSHVVLTFPFSQGISVLIVGHNVFILLSSTHSLELRQYCWIENRQ